MYDCLRRSHTMLFKANIAWDQSPQWERAKSGEREKNRRAKGAERWTGEGERAAEPADMPLKCHVSLSLLCSFCKKKFEFEMSKIASKEIANWRNISFGEEK